MRILLPQFLLAPRFLTKLLKRSSVAANGGRDIGVADDDGDEPILLHRKIIV